MLSQKEVLAQSNAAMKQWGDTWRSHAKVNGEILKEKGTTNQRIFGHGIGRKAICVAFAPGLEKEVETLKNKPASVDILCVDKAMSYLLDHGVKPNFVYCADAGVDYDKWCAPYIEQTKDISLVLNVCANPKWARHWKGNVFYVVNQDNIKTEKIFAPIAGCNELVKASSNVGNSLVVHASTYLLYDEYYLVGYEFSWGWNDNYYCGHDSDKRWFMNHIQILNANGDMVNTSTNLYFSARWLMDYVKAILYQQRKKVYNCSHDSICNIPYYNLQRMFEAHQDRQLTQAEIDMVINTRLMNIRVTAQEGEGKLQEVLQKNKVFDIIVRTLPDDLFQELQK